MAGGGGLLTVPALLTTGMPPHLALGTNKLAATFGSSTSSYTFYKKKLFDPVFWRQGLLATAVGAIAGTIFVDAISTDWLERLLPLIIAFTAIYTLFSKPNAGISERLPKNDRQLQLRLWAQGSLLGFYDGMAGPGTGAFWTVSNLWLHRLSILLATGVARAMNFVSNACSLSAFIYFGHVNFIVGLSMGICIMAGAYLGAHSAIRLGAKFIRPVFICVAMAMAIKLAFDAW